MDGRIKGNRHTKKKTRRRVMSKPVSAAVFKRPLEAHIRTRTRAPGRRARSANRCFARRRRPSVVDVRRCPARGALSVCPAAAALRPASHRHGRTDHPGIQTWAGLRCVPFDPQTEGAPQRTGYDVHVHTRRAASDVRGQPDCDFTSLLPTAKRIGFRRDPWRRMGKWAGTPSGQQTVDRSACPATD